MPHVTDRAIVSASGYTKTAIKKANFHSVSLYALTSWKDKKFSKVTFAEDFEFHQRICYWHKAFPEHLLYFAGSRNPTSEKDFSRNSAIFLPNDVIYQYPTLELLFRKIDQIALHNFSIDRNNDELSSGQIKQANVFVNMKDRIRIEVNGNKQELERIQIRGPIIVIKAQLPSEYNMLTRYDQTQPIAGCVVAESSEFGLVGLAVNDLRPIGTFFQIPISDRLKKKIYRQTLK
jgi:hypothetical protein